MSVTAELHARAAANLEPLAFVGLSSRFDDSAGLFCRTLVITSGPAHPRTALVLRGCTGRNRARERGRRRASASCSRRTTAGT